jgi:hypothetical protein
MCDNIANKGGRDNHRPNTRACHTCRQTYDVTHSKSITPLPAWCCERVLHAKVSHAKSPKQQAHLCDHKAWRQAKQVWLHGSNSRRHLLLEAQPLLSLKPVHCVARKARAHHLRSIKHTRRASSTVCEKPGCRGVELRGRPPAVTSISLGATP